MAEERTLTQEGFALLLRWLDADSESAARKYEAIRSSLIRIYAGRGCHEADLLADLTFDRVTLKIPELYQTYEGDPALYFYGVAKNVFREWIRQQKRHVDVVVVDIFFDDEGGEKSEDEYMCLEKCLSKFASKTREMIVEYYRDEKRAKIERRRRLSEKLGITSGALQIRASRVRAKLFDCIRDCLATN